ncbi:MAG TPA: zf-HC2 domain-containing protein [Acidimicrobiia bacterium]|nr:zf-HC2 domain-containing protein [Acidimicrobiia bacterium]
MFRRRRLTCQQVVELVTDYLEGVMEPARRARFEAHLAGCHGCTAYLEQFRTTVAVVGRIELAPSQVPAPVMSELLQAFRRWADDDDRETT